MNSSVVGARQYGVLFQFGLMGIVWGSSFLFMKVALEGVSFTQVVWSREILGALTLGIFMLVGRHRLPREPIVYAHFTVIAFTNCVIPHLLFAWAQLHVSSGLAAIYNSITPIATAVLVALVFRVETLNRGQVFGVLLGIVGVVIIIAPWQWVDVSADFWGQLACIGAAISYGVAIAYTRKFVSKTTITGTTVAFLNIGTAAVIMLLLTPLVAFGPIDLSLPVVGSLLLLGALSTGVAYIWNIAVLRAWGATNVSTVTYLIPVVAVALGFFILGETLSWHEPVGAVLVLTGILYTQGRLQVGRRTRLAQQSTL